MSRIWEVNEKFYDKKLKLSGFVSKTRISIGSFGQEAIYNAVFYSLNHANSTFDQEYVDLNWTDDVSSYDNSESHIQIYTQQEKLNKNYDCDHSWREYNGFNEVYEYCTKCDKKKRH